MIASIFLNIFLWYLQILQSWTWQCNIAGLQKQSIVGWFKSVNLIAEFQSLEWSYSLLLVIAISLSGFWLTIYQSWARNSCLVLHWTCAKVAYLSFNWKRMFYDIQHCTFLYIQYMFGVIFSQVVFFGICFVTCLFHQIWGIYTT